MNAILCLLALVALGGICRVMVFRRIRRPTTFSATFSATASGRASAYGAARAYGTPSEPDRRGHRQPVGEVGGKRGGHDSGVDYDAGKKVTGRKIHALVDVEACPCASSFTRCVQDRDGAAFVLDKIRARFSWLELVWADSGYNARQIDEAVAKLPALRLEIVKRSDDAQGFAVLLRRWVVIVIVCTTLPNRTSSGISADGH